ncbi:hormogonium polysaccharide secretion pseudopilin HpsB [Calothrix sp. CCY 0018]|uniref:hormogonium polysaccharide secretion pseudopilin HpsB n=1 Tax=Calothrix sp. CCY 0018 TaxID=3103864 RepID=UPI0039C76255
MIHLKRQHVFASSNSGFTIIESLVAIIVVGILMTAIAPTIVLSVATRVQARRIELAADASQSYIDGVRTGTVTPPTLPDNQTEEQLESYDFSQYDAPEQGTLTCTANSYCTSPDENLYCIDGDTDGSCTINSSKDMIVQSFRYSKSSIDPEDGYSLGVRVYRADAFDSNRVTELKALKDEDTEKQSTFTGGTGLRSVQTPLMEITTDISNGTNFGDFCERLKVDTDDADDADDADDTADKSNC